jgi:hypothetical protein
MNRRLRAIFRNAVVWGAGWGTLGFLTTLVLEATGAVKGVGVLDAVGMGVRIGVVGGVAGVLFSSLISVAYRGKRIQDISWVKFGLGGAVVSAVGLPLFMQTASLLTGGGLVPWRHLYSDIALFAVFGGAAAALSMKLAQVAAAKPDESGEPTLLTRGDELPFQQARDRDASHIPR